MTWFISVLIVIGIILALFFIVALYDGFVSGKKWAVIIVSILVFGVMFAILVSGVHSMVFG